MLDSQCVKMENNIHHKSRPPIEELLKRIQALQDAHDHLKQQMLKFVISNDRKTTNSRSSRGETQHSALNLTETNYFNILQSTDVSIFIIDTKGCIVFRNQAWENMYGYTAAETLGKFYLPLVIERSDIPIANDFLQQILKGESGTGEFPVRNKRGDRFVVITSNVPLRDENGTVIGIITVTASRGRYHNKHSSKVNKTRPKMDSTLSSKSEWEGFDSTTRPFSWHWLQSDQQHEYGLKMSGKVENQPWVVNPNCAGHDKKAVCSYGNFVIKWEDLIIKKLIGRGSCGTVYHAVWQGSDVALKLIPKQEHSRAFAVSFMQEVSLMKRLRHPNIELFMGTVTSPDQGICIVTEFLCRGNLLKLLHRNVARLDWRRRIHMAIDIARGINYLHHCLPPIIHRDLNSSNLLVNKDWTVKVGGLGLSRTKHETYVTTKEGIVTPQWTAPEVLRNEQADERSNVYSYGVVLWEMTTEKIPWDGLNSLQVMEAVGWMNQGLDIPKDVDPRWASLIQRCLSREPQSRPTFQEILHELKDLHMQLKFLPRPHN